MHTTIRTFALLALTLFFIAPLTAQDPSLVGFWTFDDSTAYDSSGYGHHGIISGDPDVIISMKGSAIQFDGINDVIRVSDTDQLDTDTTMTLSLWIKPDSIFSGGSKFISKWYSSPQQGDWIFSLSSQDSCGGNCVSWYLGFANYGLLGYPDGFARGGPSNVDYFFRLHEWNFVTVTFDSGLIKTYFNGQIINESRAAFSYTSLSEYGTDDIYIGRYHNASRTYYNFKGGLDEIRIYNRPLSALEIKDLYDQVTAIDHSVNKTKLPSQFQLHQNYPNPFNPVTAIGYQLSAVSDVNLSIYNLLGQKVATLVSEKQQAGHYQVEWNAGGFASGVYVYRIVTDKGFTDTRKLLLLK